MDLSEINLDEKAEQGAVMHLEHPVTGEKLFVDEEKKTPMSITLLGMDSSAYRNKQKQINSDRMMNAAKRRSSKGVNFVMSDEQAIDLLASCATDMTILEGGELLVFSKSSVTDLFTRHTWMREQADEFIGDRANLFTTQ